MNNYTCPACRGSGRIYEQVGKTVLNYETCQKCKGSGFLVDRRHYKDRRIGVKERRSGNPERRGDFGRRKGI